jgi:hypothetical protein
MSKDTPAMRLMRRGREALALELARDIAKLNYDGETLPDGTDFEMENDDAVDTVNSLIRKARQIVGEKS